MRPYTGSDGKERRYILTGEVPINIGIDFDTEVGITVIPLGDDHDFNVLARDAVASLHSLALKFGDVAVAREIRITMKETVRSLR